MQRVFRAAVKRYVVTDGQRFRLANCNPSDHAHLPHTIHANKMLKKDVGLLNDLQEKLYAQDRWGVLLIFQAMDAAGKDGVIKHVMSGIDPKGCDVHAFKAPSNEELDHDFLWRTTRVLPERGRIGIFNRSYYEETLVARVHPEILGREKLPSRLISKHIWRERFQDINAFERYFARNGFLIRKFFLHVSRAEQRRRLLDRLERPEKNWKFSIGDLAERDRWRAYMSAYEDMIRHTATPHAPWVVVPADDKKFARAVVARIVIDALSGLALEYPKLDADQRKDVARARRILEHEGRRIKS
jgi:PPK2 family polyphosphate:nucleotide phosphotransferase